MLGRMIRAFMAMAFLFSLKGATAAQAPNPDDLLARGKTAAFQEGPRSALPLFEQALPLFRSRRDLRGEALTLGYMGYCYEELADYPQALKFLNQSLALKMQLGDRREEGKTLNIFGLVYWGMSDYPKAIQHLNQALNIARAVHDQQLEGATLNNLGLISDEQGNYVHSIELFHQALEVNRAAHFDRGEGDVLGNLGGDYQLLGEYRQALTYYQQARELDERRNLKPNLSEDLVNLGLCWLGLGQPDRAIRAFSQTLALSHTIGLKKIEADAHKGKGSALLETGKYDAAREEFRQAIQTYKEAGLNQQLIEALNDDGSLHAQVGDTESAEADFRRAVDLSRSIGHPRGVTINLIALGELEWRRHNYNQAASLYAEAFERAHESKDQSSMASSLLDVALVLRDEGRLEDARPKVQQALEIGRSTGATLVEAQALYTLAELDRRGGQLEQSLSQYAAAEKTARATGDSELSWQSAYGRGQALEALNRNREALLAYRQAVEIVESVRNRLREERFQSGYLQDKYQVYVALVRLLLKMGKDSEAFLYSEKLRAFSYASIIHQALPPSGFHDEDELGAEIRQLQRALQEKMTASPSPGSRQAVELVSNRLRAAEEKYQNRLDDLRSTHPKEAALNGLLVASAREVQARLPAHSALVEYIVGNNEVSAFVLTESSVHAASVPVKVENLRAKIELFRDLVKNSQSEDWRQPAESLDSLLIEPIAKRGWLKGINRLYLVPNAVLYYLPFAALPRPSNQGSHYLIEDYELEYLPAATALVYPRIERDPQGTLLALAPAQSGLRYAQEEVRDVGDLYPKGSLVLEGRSATKQAFEAEAGRFGKVHLAAHGFFDKLDPMFSGVQLEPDAHDDGRLEVHEILRMRLNARLVTLSACETALGSGYFSEFPAGDDIVGLTRAFLSAGSSSVLASLWEVNDRATSDFMVGFYRELQRNGEIEALRKAQIDFIHSAGQRAEPYYWAPFVLVGSKK
jgi:CHAT domain-containing protein/tetratricopeptide (TPR) repeat protein